MRTAVAIRTMLRTRVLPQIVLLAAWPATAHWLDSRCAQAVDIAIERGEKPIAVWPETLPLAEISGRFSPAIDGCIATVVDDLSNVWFVFDLHRSLLREFPTLFQCNRDGVLNVILEHARTHRGYIGNLDYREYADDGQGGLPMTLATPSAVYSRE